MRGAGIGPSAKFVAHELRWSRTIRAVDRLGHLGSAQMHPIPFAILAVLTSEGAAWEPQRRLVMQALSIPQIRVVYPTLADKESGYVRTLMDPAVFPPSLRGVTWLSRWVKRHIPTFEALCRVFSRPRIPSGAI